MKHAQPHTDWLLLTVALLAFVVGYFFSTDSSTVQGLEAQNAALRSQLAAVRLHRRSPSLPESSADSGQGLPQTGLSTHTNSAAIPSVSPSEFVQQRKEGLLSNLVLRTAAKSSDEYSTLFWDLGLSVPDAERFKSNLVALHRGAVKAGEALTELQRDRRRYDQEIHAALGDENYQVYRTWEESKPAAREYDMLQRFSLKNNGETLDPKYATQIIQLLKDTGATTTGTWHGPYDPLPNPLVGGKEMALKHIAEEIDQTRQKSAAAIEQLKQLDLPPGYADLVSDYFSEKIREKQDQLEVFNRPLREIVSELERKANERGSTENEFAQP